MTMTTTVEEVSAVVKNGLARAYIAGALLASGGYANAAGEFTDQIKSAKAVDTKAMRESAKSGADNIGFIVGVGGMLLGFIFVLVGFVLIASAARSEGRKPAAPGWIMVAIGGCLGAGMALYLWLVGTVSGAAS